jgi:phosphatidylglycerol lysyltransferase
MHLFRAYASTVGKHAIVLAASSAMRTISPLFAAIWIGAEQRLDLATFDTRGRAGEKLRLALNHARRVGASARELDPRHDVTVELALRLVEDAWKAARPSRRLASFLRTEPLENAEHRRYFGVETPGLNNATLQSFLVCSPVSRRGVYLQDLVRDPGAPRGAAELATVFALDTFRREGLEFATLGISPFFPAGDAPRGGVLSRAADWCIRHFDRLYHFAGLRQFRAKFATASVDPLYVLHWPRTLTPLAIWDIAALLSGR